MHLKQAQSSLSTFVTTRRLSKVDKIAAYHLLLTGHPLYLEKIGNRFAMPVIGAIGGGAVGGIAGAASTKDKEKKRKRALLGGVGGAAIGGSTGFLLRKYVNNRRINPVRGMPSSVDPHDVVLVLNADTNADVIEKLRTSGLSGLSKDELYKATQGLYKDTQPNIDTKFGRFFSGAEAPGNNEYDVHVVRLRGVSPSLRGLDRDVNQMDRLDVFRRLRESGLKVDVSPRVSSHAYEKHVYTR